MDMNGARTAGESACSISVVTALYNSAPYVFEFYHRTGRPSSGWAWTMNSSSSMTALR